LESRIGFLQKRNVRTGIIAGRRCVDQSYEGKIEGHPFDYVYSKAQNSHVAKQSYSQNRGVKPAGSYAGGKGGAASPT
jgi:hypothetical protein